MPRCHHREVLHHGRRYREVPRRDTDAGSASRLVDLVKLGADQPRRADDHGNGPLDRRHGVVENDRWVGVIDQDVRAQVQSRFQVVRHANAGKLTAEDRSDILPRGATRDRAPENEPVAVQDRRRETAADAAGRTGKTNSHCDLSSA